MKKLKIEAFTDLEYNNKVGEYVVMFNPSTYSQKYDIEYDDVQGQGTTGSTLKFGYIKPQEYTFEFIFDGTGVTGELYDVAEEIENFLSIVGKYKGDTHRTLYLRICWGQLTCDCALKNADITYSLFNPDGYPLRAKITATFLENKDDKLRSSEENSSSPDLTHYREIKQGENLQLLCNEIYGDPSYYIDVAKVNRLKNFRKLNPGSIISFPPLKSGESK
ncbi:MAG: hypothetical protein JW995_08460 [Melioribacteraceae bacterium]|nr:hypothetical protein [Melioribacteraceae bacterium]